MPWENGSQWLFWEHLGAFGGVLTMNARKRAAVMALASGQGAGAVADEIGVHVKTLHRWRADPEFVAALRGVQNEALEQLLAGLLGQAGAVVGAVGDGLEDPDPSVRLRAAALWLSSVPQLIETMSFEDRLSRLENRSHEQK